MEDRTNKVRYSIQHSHEGSADTYTKNELPILEYLKNNPGYHTSIEIRNSLSLSHHNSAITALYRLLHKGLVEKKEVIPRPKRGIFVRFRLKEEGGGGEDGKEGKQGKEV